MEDHASVCAKVVNEISSKKVHIVAHSMGGAIGLFFPASLLNSALTFANLEGNLSSEDCGIVSRKTVNVPFQKLEKELSSGADGLKIAALRKGRADLEII